ncbi:hypothetical protein AAHA92_30462 [Salvia divinorum]|uniref:Uncharacterized protein n=1 Tax=Salvia divinorum TaxID=28513 RepID=A0ABD1FTH7_SALDI
MDSLSSKGVGRRRCEPFDKWNVAVGKDLNRILIMEVLTNISTMKLLLAFHGTLSILFTLRFLYHPFLGCLV